MTRILVNGVSHESIGRFACKTLAAHDTDVELVILQRDPETDSSKQAIADLANVKHTVYKFDLLEEDEVAIEGPPFDVVILVAATMSQQALKVNVLGSHRLINLMERRGLLSNSCRIVVVSSSLHTKADLNTSLDLLDSDELEPSLQSYGQTKLLQAIDAQYWHAHFKNSGRRVVLVSPGFIPTSGLSRDVSAAKRLAMRWILHYMPFARTLSQGGNSVAYAAVLDPLPESDIVIYLSPNMEQIPTHPGVRDAAAVQKVETWCREQLTR